MSLANPIPDPGGKISAPGIYDLTMARYHGDCAAGPSISSSGLRTIWSQSLAHYFLTSPYNPEPPEPEDRPHFSLGRAAHHLLFLGRAGFDDEFVTRPEQWSDWRTKDAKLWREAMLGAGKTVITAGELEQIAGMAKTLGAHPLVKAGILDGYVERSLIWRDQESGVWLKSRPDSVPNDSGDFVDLKTTTDVSTEAIARTIASFGYHAQGALVGMACRALLGREMQTFTLVFVETKPPHCVRIVTLKPDDIIRGERQVRAAIGQFAHASATGNWPGPGGDQQDAEYLDLPSWARMSIDNRLELIEATAPEPFPHAAE